jgi:hypothetical protein
VTTADSVYGPIGTINAARNSTALDVAQIGQVDLTWDISRFVQLHALYARTFAGQYVKDAGRTRAVAASAIPTADPGTVVRRVTLALARVRYTSRKLKKRPL